MDEENTDSVPTTSGLKISAAKQKKKTASSKEKTDKAAVSAEPLKEKKRTTLDLVCEAIEFSGEKRKGASVQAIKKYIKSKQGTEQPNLNYLVKEALTKGVVNGTLERPPHSKDATGATGFFRLVKVEVPKRTAKSIKQKTEEHASDSEVTEKTTKPRKRNLSDTYIEEMRGSLTSTPKPLTKQTVTSKDAKKTKKVPLKKTAGDKDTSDTKIMMKKTEGKSMKSYSSDTEVDFHKKVKTAKEPLKKAKPEKSKADSTSKSSETKVNKLYSSANGKENETNTKLKKKSKKQP